MDDNVGVADVSIRKKGAGSGEILCPKPQIQRNVLALDAQRPKQVGIVIGRMALADRKTSQNQYIDIFAEVFPEPLERHPPLGE